MKKEIKIILILLSAVLAVATVAIGIFCSGSTLFSDIFGKSPEMQVEILEAQYKITEKPKVLKNLCDALFFVGNEDESREHYEKVAYYCELYLKGSNAVDRSAYSQYLIALSRISETEKLKTEAENFLNKCNSDDDFQVLYHALFVIKQQGTSEEQTYVKQLAKKISDGSYLKSNSKMKYDELVNKYTLLAE